MLVASAVLVGAAVVVRLAAVACSSGIGVVPDPAVVSGVLVGLAVPARPQPATPRSTSRQTKNRRRAVCRIMYIRRCCGDFYEIGNLTALRRAVRFRRKPWCIIVGLRTLGYGRTIFANE